MFSLSSAQRAFAAWERDAPLSVADLLVVRGRLDPDRLLSSIREESASCGLGRLVLARRRFHYLETRDVPFRTTAAPHRYTAEFESLCRHELNTPFLQAAYPIRWILLDGGRDRDSAVAAVYRHVACDGRSMQILMDHVLRRYAGTPRPPMTLHPSAPRPSVSASVRDAASAVRHAVRLRGAYRAYDADPSDERVETVAIGLPPLTTAPGTTPAQRVTAAVVQALAEHMPGRRDEPRRRGLALSVIVDTRRGTDSLDTAFGVYAAHTTLHLPDGDLAPARIGAATAAQVRHIVPLGRASGSTWPWRASAWIARRGSAEARRWYRKQYPLVAAVSLATDPRYALDTPFSTGEHYRSGNPGPAVPMIFAAMWLGRAATATVTFRTAVIEPGAARTLLDRVAALLAESRDGCARRSDPGASTARPSCPASSQTTSQDGHVSISMSPGP